MPIPAGWKAEENAAVAEKTLEGWTPEAPQQRGDFLPADIPTYMRFKYYTDRASSEYSEVMNEAMMGRMDPNIALTKAKDVRDYWMAQAGPYQDMELKDFTKDPAKFVAGETASLVPYMVSSQVEGAKYAGIVGGGFAAVALLAGQAGPQALFPEEFITVPAAFWMGSKVGFMYGVFQNMMKREGAQFYGEMIEKGISNGTATMLGLGVGTLNGALEMCQFNTLSKPFKRAYAKVLQTKVGKDALVQSLGRYAKTLGINVLQEDLQEIVPLVAQTIAGVAEEKGDVVPTKKEWINRLLETTVRSAAGMAAIGVPGAAVDVTTSMRTQKLIKKQEDVALLDKIIAELTGKEPDIYNKLVKMTPEQIMELPEIVAAREKAQAIQETYTINTPERQQLRQELFRKYYGTGAKNKLKIADIVLGPPGSGKNTNVVEALAEERGSMIIDSDNIKEDLPEYQQGIGAAAVHKESSDIIEEAVFYEALTHGDNVVLARVGKNLDKIRQIIMDLKKEGYTVNLHYVDLDTHQSAARLVTRFLEKGRFVDPEYVYSIGQNPKITYNTLKEEVNNYAEYSTDVPKGQPATIIDDSADIGPAQLKQRGLQRGQLAKGAEAAQGAEGKGPPLQSKKLRDYINTILANMPGLQEKIAEMDDTEQRVEQAKYALAELNELRRSLAHKMRKYRQNYLAEELTGIPAYYITRKDTAMSPDEMMEYLRDMGIGIENETELKEFYQDLENSRAKYESEIAANRPALITQRETTVLKNRISAIEQGIAAGRKYTLKEVKQIQAEIISLLEVSKLAPKDKAKFMRTVKNIQTENDLVSELPKITKRIMDLREAAERSDIVDDLRKIFERGMESLPVEYQDILANIESGILLKQRNKKAHARLENMRAFVERMAEEGNEINIPEEKLALLEKTSVDQLSTDELRDLHETVTRLFHQGQLKNKLLTALEDRNFDAIQSEMIGIITQGQGLTEESTFVKALREQNKSLREKSLNHVKNYIIENMRPELMLNLLDGGEPGLITNTLFGTLWDATKAELRENKKVSDTIKDIHAKFNYAEIFTKKYAIGRFIGMTKDQALFIYANSFNDSNRAHLIGSGITDEDIQAVSDFLSDDEKLAVENMIRFYDEYQYPILDQIFASLEGVHLGKEKFYFPIDRVEDISFNKELEKDIMQRNYIRRTGVSKGFTKERVTSKKGFSDFSYFGTILRNNRKVEHYKAFAESVRDANKILNNKEIKAAIKEKFGDKYHQVLDKWLKDVAYGSNRQAMAFIDKLALWIRTNYVTAVLGGNLLTAAKQPISFIQGAEMAGKYQTMKALWQYMTTQGMDQEIDSKSDLMANRRMRQERELGEIVAQRSIRQQIGKVTGYQMIREKSMLPIVAMDKNTCNIVWLSAYNGAKADNMSEQQAIDHADMVIRRTQPMSGMLNLPDTFRGPEYQKFFTLFRNQPNQNFNLLVQTALKKQKGQIKGGEFASNLAFYFVVPAVMFGIISRKRLPENVGEFAKDILNGALGGLIFVGNMTNMLAQGWLGSTTPLDALLADVFSVAQAKEMSTKLDHLVGLLSKLSGLPYLAAKRLIKGEPFGTVKKGKTDTLKPI